MNPIFRDDNAVPQEIIEAVVKIDTWATQNGIENYAIGPIQKRMSGDTATLIIKEIKEMKERLDRIESFLVL